MKTVVYQGKTFRSVPDWARFIAADCDGEVWAYRHQPKPLNDSVYLADDPSSSATCEAFRIGRQERSKRLPPVYMMPPQPELLIKAQPPHKVMALRELMMAQQAYVNALTEFKLVTNISSLNDAQEDVLVNCCEGDARAVSDKTLHELLAQLDALN